ncbi:MAG: TerC family protein [Burkholderiaceae bacterium]
MNTIGTPLLWAGFGAFVLLALAVDFIVLKKEGAHRVGLREAAIWSAIWVALSLVFAAALWWWLSTTAGPDVANARTVEFLTGYLIEKSLAIDNVFVFLTIFTYFALPAEFQKRALMIGIIAAIVLRAAMIFAGAILIERFDWILYVFGAFLVLTGIKMWTSVGKESSLDDNPALKMLKRVMRVSPHYDGERFFTIHDGVRMATPLLLIVALIGVTDVIFAVDSIPAIFAITTDPFIVLTSNIFAVLGLRAMFFLLADMADRFHLLPYGLAVILLFVGVKMLIAGFFHIPPLLSLGLILGILGTTILLSLKMKPALQATVDERTQ